MEADLRRYYGVRLTDLWRGELSWRELSVLVEHLPPGSATWAADHGVTYGADPVVALLADVYGALTGEPHPLRPTPVATPAAAKSGVIARLKAQRERIARQRGETP